MATSSIVIRPATLSPCWDLAASYVAAPYGDLGTSASSPYTQTINLAGVELRVLDTNGHPFADPSGGRHDTVIDRLGPAPLPVAAISIGDPGGDQHDLNCAGDAGTFAAGQDAGQFNAPQEAPGVTLQDGATDGSFVQDGPLRHALDGQAADVLPAGDNASDAANANSAAVVDCGDATDAGHADRPDLLTIDLGIDVSGRELIAVESENDPQLFDFTAGEILAGADGDADPLHLDALAAINLHDPNELAGLGDTALDRTADRPTNAPQDRVDPSTASEQADDGGPGQLPDSLPSDAQHQPDAANDPATGYVSSGAWFTDAAIKLAGLEHQSDVTILT